MRISDWSSDVCSSDLTGWLAATIGRHAVPVKGVVPNLRRIVKYTTRRLLHDVFQGSRFEFRACNQVVQVGNVSLMMLAVVELERFLGNGRSQGVECVRKRGKRKSHFHFKSGRAACRGRVWKYG